VYSRPDKYRGSSYYFQIQKRGLVTNKAHTMEFGTTAFLVGQNPAEEEEIYQGTLANPLYFFETNFLR